MNRLITLILPLFVAQHLAAQCSDCRSLDEALKDPNRVVTLDLSNTGLSRFPAELLQLHNLRKLDVSNNQLVDLSLAGTLFSLKELDLSGNAPNSGKLAVLNEQFPQLEQLDLSSCRLAILPPFSLQFPRLTALNLSENGLTCLPAEMGQLTQLRTLLLNHNQLTQTDAVIGSLWKLQRLEVMDNPELNMRALINSLKASTQLQELALTVGEWRSETHRILAALPLKNVCLDGLNGNVPRGICDNPTICSLTVQSAVSTEKMAASLGKMGALRALTIKNSAIPADLNKAKQITSLTIAGSSTANISAIGNWDFLKELDITETQLDAAVIAELATLLPGTNIVTTHQPVSKEMASNRLEPIVELPWSHNVINASESHTIEVEQVVFYIPSNGFLRNDGSIYNGEVAFNVKVYNDPLVMALDGAPMSYNENGRDELFTSDGMIDLRATTIDGEPLFPNPDQPVEVSIPDLQPELTTDLFFFDSLTATWQKASQTPVTLNSSVMLDSIMDSLNRIDLTRFVNLRETDRLFALDFKKKNMDASQLSFRTYLPSATVLTDRRNLFVTRRLHEGKLIAGQTWHIDTMMTPQLRNLLREMDRSYSLSKRHIKSRNFSFRSEPRTISNLHIAPDFANDHYRLTFRYRDSLVNLPVYLESSSNRKTLIRHKRFQERLVKAMHTDNREQKRIEARKKAIVANYVDQNRAAVINNTLAGTDTGPIRPGTTAVEDIRKAGRTIGRIVFTAVTFGLINCDAIRRAPQPVVTATLKPQLINQNSQAFSAPANVRIVLPDTYAYMSSPATNIPILPNGRMLVLMDLTDSQLGVMVVEPNTRRLPETIRTFETTGKDARQLRQLIMQEL